MAEANNQEDQGNKEVQDDQANQDKVSTPEELEAIKAQLEEEKTANATLKEASDKKDVTIADLETKRGELESSLSEAKKQSEALTTSLKEARDQAVAKYATMAKALNPTIPEDMISGETIEELDASVEKAKGLVAAVKKTLESETAAAKVPAGAPTRGETTEGMSNKDMIAAGLRQKGGVVA